MDKKNCNCDHKHSHNKSHGNGFLLGVIVGVIVTLLFTTKKGREIVKDLTEKGLDKFSDFQKVMNEAVSDVQETAGDMEEELVELVEDEMGDYVASNAIGKEVLEEATSDVAGSVAADSFGESISEEKDKPKEPQVKKEEGKHHVIKGKVEHKTDGESPFRQGSEGQAKGGSSKRFFLRRVKRS